MESIEKGIIFSDARALNEMTLIIRATVGNEAFARNSVCAFVSALDPKISELEDIKTAVSEAFTNCAVHAYRDVDDGKVEITTSLFDDYARIVIKDNGRGIIDVNKATEPFYTSRPDQDRSGLGFTIMETFMTGMRVESGESGTLVTLFKELNRHGD